MPVISKVSPKLFIIEFTSSLTPLLFDEDVFAFIRELENINRMLKMLSDKVVMRNALFKLTLHHIYINYSLLQD